MLTNILKNRGIFSKEIKSRFKQKQIKVNGEVLENDIDIDVDSILDVGDFVFLLMRNNVWKLRLQMFGLEGLFSSNIKNDLTEFLQNFMLVRTSKKDIFVIKIKENEIKD